MIWQHEHYNLLKVEQREKISEMKGASETDNEFYRERKIINSIKKCSISRDVCNNQ